MSSGKVRSLCLVSLHFAPFLYTLICIQIHTPLQILCSLILQYRFIRHILCTKHCAIKWTNNLVRLNYMKRIEGIMRLHPLHLSSPPLIHQSVMAGYLLVEFPTCTTFQIRTYKNWQSTHSKIYTRKTTYFISTCGDNSWSLVYANIQA